MSIINYLKKRNIVIFSLLLLVAIFLSACTPQQTETSVIDEKESSTSSSDEPSSTPSTSDWRNTQLRDVATGKTFKLSDFKGKSILLETFAVWCPTCTRQQREVQEMRTQEENDEIVHISLDVDPNEDEARVREHLNRNGFDWFYAVAPPSMTRSLIGEFGIKIVNAPSAPMILICEDQSARFLRTGVKSADDLFSEVAKGC